MSNFKQAFADVLKWEGGYNNIGADAGGATNHGISLRFLKSLPLSCGDITGDGHVTQADIQALTPADAERIYKKHFWDYYRLGEINDQAVATKLFNCFVNMRGKTAALVAQRSANDFRCRLVEDGIMGSKSIAAINRQNSEHLLDCIKVQMWDVYKNIVAADPTQQLFLKGWQNRAFSNV
ncbi:glycoside hydrolase family 108 protein [Endozoicomonas lisbonensis]|uniref:glycoside hydrolase family 108 protein n=1 Tax=Endozoicomonas lisbonensis TaxID=3120522 RepID=UPI003390A4CD